MKPEADTIDWSVVHRTHEPNIYPDPEKALEKFWKQRLHNLEQVSLTEPDYCRLREEFEQKLQAHGKEETAAA